MSATNRGARRRACDFYPTPTTAINSFLNNFPLKEGGGSARTGCWFPKTLYKYEKQLAKLQRQLAHKKKFSNNWYKQKHKIALLHEKIVNIRKDNLHKISHNLFRKTN